VQEIVKLHGFPTSIISDRGILFLSTFWTKEVVTKFNMTSAYHPQTDGQSEAVNKCVETYLRCFSGYKPRQWPKWLPWAGYRYNTNYHGSIKMSPFKALYGRDLPPLLRGEGGASIEEIQGLMQERNSMLDGLKMHLDQT